MESSGIDAHPLPPDAICRQLILEARDYAIFALDPTGKVASWNIGAERIKGYTGGEIIGQPFECFYPPTACADGLPTRLLEMARSTGRAEDQGWRVRKDGTQFWADVVITCLRGPDGRLLGYAKITRDITERRRAEEALRAAKVAAEAALAQVSPIRRLLPICSYCKRIRDSRNHWQQVEEYFRVHGDMRFSHGICPDCFGRIAQPDFDGLAGE